MVNSHSLKINPLAASRAHAAASFKDSHGFGLCVSTRRFLERAPLKRICMGTPGVSKKICTTVIVFCAAAIWTSVYFLASSLFTAICNEEQALHYNIITEPIPLKFLPQICQFLLSFKEVYFSWIPLFYIDFYKFSLSELHSQQPTRLLRFQSSTLQHTESDICYETTPAFVKLGNAPPRFSIWFRIGRPPGRFSTKEGQL